MSSFPTASSLPARVLKALSSEVTDGSVCSVLSDSGRHLLLTDSPTVGAGGELFMEFPEDAQDLDVEMVFASKAVELFSGVWTTDILVDGEALEPVGNWETLCEAAEKDYAFFELSLPLTGGRRISRRLFFAYHESLVLLFDEIDGNSSDRGEGSDWEYRAFLPLAPGLHIVEDADARELLLQRRASSPNAAGKSVKKAKPSDDQLSEVDRFLADLYDDEEEEMAVEAYENAARLFPLNLPEWKEDKDRGDLAVTQKPLGLELSARRFGGALTSSLLVDLNTRRAERRCTWRPVTVGEKMEVVAEDDAVGRKIQLGQEQYVLYASTSEYPAIRSILSRNLMSDFMFGKFLTSRGVVPIVDVDIEEEE